MISSSPARSAWLLQSCSLQISVHLSPLPIQKHLGYSHSHFLALLQNKRSKIAWSAGGPVIQCTTSSTSDSDPSFSILQPLPLGQSLRTLGFCSKHLHYMETWWLVKTCAGLGNLYKVKVDNSTYLVQSKWYISSLTLVDVVLGA